MRHTWITCALVVYALTCLLAVTAAPAGTLLSETFDQPFKLTGSGHSVAAVGGQYEITGTGVNTPSTYELAGPGAGAAFTVSALVGKDPGSVGSFNVGLVVGDNRIKFHPGYTPIPGALRVEGPGGFGNQNVGFVPAEGVLHPLSVTGDGAGNYTVTLKDGLGVASDFVRTWSNPTNPQTSAGLLRDGPATVKGLYDDLVLTPGASQSFGSDFSALVSGRVESTGGVLEMQGAGTSRMMYAGQTGDLLVSAKIGSTPGSGNTNVGMQIGGNDLVFHPGYGNGAFRVGGTGGFGNQNMGFTPAGGLLHDMYVTVDAATGQFTAAVINASNPANVYVAHFTNATYAPGTSQIGFKYGSGTGGDTGQFDDLTVATRTVSTRSDSTPWAKTIAAANPRHWYRMNDTGLFASDSGSAKYHGVYVNGPLQNQQGLIDGAAQFDGADDRIMLGGGVLSGPWTAEFVVQKLGQEPSGILLGPTGRNNGALKLDQWNNTGQIGYTQFGVADWLFSPGVSLPVGEFAHLTFVGVPGTGLMLYVDGVLAGTNANYIPLTLGDIGSFEPANMLLDEVVVFDRALSASEIHTHAGAVIPEPATMALCGLAAAGLGAYVRRRRS